MIVQDVHTTEVDRLFTCSISTFTPEGGGYDSTSVTVFATPTSPLPLLFPVPGACAKNIEKIRNICTIPLLVVLSKHERYSNGNGYQRAKSFVRLKRSTGLRRFLRCKKTSLFTEQPTALQGAQTSIIDRQFRKSEPQERFRFQLKKLLGCSRCFDGYLRANQGSAQ